MSNLTFSDKGWEDYLYWQLTDKKMLRKINELLKDIQRNGYSGIGKPEPLKYRKAWSRRIDLEHRLVYAWMKMEIFIFFPSKDIMRINIKIKKIARFKRLSLDLAVFIKR